MFRGCKILILPKPNQNCPTLINFFQISLQFYLDFTSILLKSNQF